MRLELYGCATEDWSDLQHARAQDAQAFLHDVNFFAEQLRMPRTRHQAEERRHVAGQALLTGIQSNLHGKDVNVLGNHLPTSLATEISFYGSRNSLGGYLLSGHYDADLPATVWCYILAKCQRHELKYQFGKSLAYFYLRNNPALVVNPHPPTTVYYYTSATKMELQ